MLVYSVLFSFIFVTVLVIALGKTSDDRKITDRLAIFQEQRGRVELTRPLNERLLNPIRIRLVTLIGKNLPAERRHRVQNALHRAGNPGNMNPAEFITLKTALALVFFLGVGIFGIGEQSLGRLVTLMALAGMTGWYGPDLFLNFRAERRTQQIKKSISDVLDLLTVCVEAGTGLDGAMAKVAEKGCGPLKEEFKRVLQEVMVGKPRKEALRGMAAKNKVEELNTFANAVVQAEQLGLGIAGVLRQQADQARLRRKQRIEEVAMKAPVKMLFPLVFFIFPAIFVVLLGPALIQIMTVLLPK